MNAIANTYINALLCDVVYVDLTKAMTFENAAPLLLKHREIFDVNHLCRCGSCPQNNQKAAQV